MYRQNENSFINGYMFDELIVGIRSSIEDVEDGINVIEYEDVWFSLMQQAK